MPLYQDMITACEWASSSFFIFSQNVFDPFIYYSHLAPLILSLGIGIFIIWSGPRDILNRILFGATMLFSTWVFLDLILWANEHPDYIMFSWSLLVLIEPFIYVVMFYFVQVFIRGKDVGLGTKALMVLPLVPTILLWATSYSLYGFNLSNCDREAVEGPLALYGYLIEVFYVLWMTVFALEEFAHTKDTGKRKQILIATGGAMLFLLTFSWGNIVGSFSDDWRVAQWGLFGMPVFIAFLSYLIVQYRALNMKIMAAQALMIALITLIASEYLFVRSPGNRILVSVTLVLAVGFGILLVRSVRREVEQREQIEQLSNEKSEFMSFASHEIRNPITAMRGLASLIYDGTAGAASKEVRESAEKIMVTGTGVLALISEFLDKSKIELGQIAYHMEVFDVGSILSTLADGFKPSAELKGLTIKKNIDLSQHLSVSADKAKLNEVIGNIIDNSIKYTKTGSVTIGVEKHNDKVLIKVSDTGAGIPKETIDKLFKKFSRADAAKANLRGTGLGLFLAKNFVEGMNGRIWVESDGEGKGSRFFVEFPSA